MGIINLFYEFVNNVFVFVMILQSLLSFTGVTCRKFIINVVDYRFINFVDEL